jgi:hypothetical protein
MILRTVKIYYSSSVLLYAYLQKVEDGSLAYPSQAKQPCLFALFILSIKRRYQVHPVLAVKICIIVERRRDPEQIPLKQKIPEPVLEFILTNTGSSVKTPIAAFFAGIVA